MTPEKSRFSKRTLIVAAGLFSFLFALLVMELGLRLFVSVKDELIQFEGVNAINDLASQLDPYEQISPNKYYHWTLRPGYNASGQVVIENKIAQGKILGASANAADQEQSEATGITVNRDGFRGREIVRDSGAPKILMLGDSVTFGLTATTYPGWVQKNLAEKGIATQVINAGVEGYSTRNLLFEIDRYLALEPKIVTIMIGWNDLYTTTPSAISIFDNLAIVRTVKRIARHIETRIMEKDQVLAKMYGNAGSADKDAPEVRRLIDYLPPYFQRVESLVERLREAGAIVYLVTLPGIFTMDTEPSERALEIGHLPHYTQNPYVLAAYAEANNKGLRRLARDIGAKVLDAAAWSKENLSPRETYFSDSVHLTAEGLKKLADFMADELASDIPGLHSNSENKNN